ncbi:hypothetical protein Syun_002652 [Stephania yunnanensis]|uniref:Uncharacterized protein n=1 Tax=Stephania yunnanensis TaxID=152371 RepID=A0AAP0Q7C8_9MAGN
MEREDGGIGRWVRDSVSLAVFRLFLHDVVVEQVPISEFELLWQESQILMGPLLLGPGLVGCGPGLHAPCTASLPMSRNQAFQVAQMGAGGRMSAPPTKKPAEADVHRRAPYTKPPFSVGDLKKAVPPHCFNRSVIRSFSYVVWDLTVAFLFYYIATTYIPSLPLPLSLLSWLAYWVVQGCVLTGVWVIAHECGHHAFSNYQWLDDTVGLILHSALLVPYFSWKYSHRRHHSNTGSLERDEVFVPKHKSKLAWFSKYINNPPGRVLTLAVTLLFGWPLYLAFNVSGRPYSSFACHFDPYGPIYNDRERAQIFISDAGLLLVAYSLFKLVAAKAHPPSIAPLRLVGVGLVEGCSGDGGQRLRVLNKVFHNITDTHVAHHLFSTMPHYNAMEATKAIKPILGEYYQFDGTPFYKALWREAKECIYVEQDDETRDKGVFWYKNKL